MEGIDNCLNPLTGHDQEPVSTQELGVVVWAVYNFSPSPEGTVFV
jgi:hypothetical protein